MNQILRQLKCTVIFIAALAIVSGSAYSTATAANLDSKDLKYEYIWYQPHFLPSIDEATKTFSNFASFYCLWNGATVQTGNGDKTGIRINFGYQDDNQQMQTFPEKITPNINQLFIYHLPNLDRDYKWALDIYFTDNSNITLRTQDLDTAQRLADALATLAAANHYNLEDKTGVITQTDKLDSVFAKLNWPQKTGIIIDCVFQGGPADTAGLTHDDIVFECNGQPIKDLADLWNIVDPLLKNSPSATIDIKVFHAGQVLEKQITIPNLNYGNDNIIDSSVKPFGVAVRNLTTEEMQKATALKAGGTMVTSVTAGSSADQLGLKSGDIIVEINGKAITDTDNLKQALATGNIQAVKVWRNGNVITLNGVSSL